MAKANGKKLPEVVHRKPLQKRAYIYRSVRPQARRVVHGGMLMRPTWSLVVLLSRMDAI